MEGFEGEDFVEEVIKIRSPKKYLIPTFWLVSIVFVGMSGYLMGGAEAPPKFLAVIGEAWSNMFPNNGSEFVEVIDTKNFTPSNLFSDEADRVFSGREGLDVDGVVARATKEELATHTLCRFQIMEGQPKRSSVIINEVAWMGGLESEDLSASDEWIELKNLSSETVDLSGWQLVDKDEQIQIIFSRGAFLSPGGFYLLERTDDNSVPNLIANLIYSGNLSNEDEGLRLFNSDCELEDEVLADSSWPAGDSTNRRTMERGSSLSWYTYSESIVDSILGSPGRENSLQITEIVNEYEDEINDKDAIGGGFSLCSQERLDAPTHEVLINEVAWAGKSENTSEEWIELYNPNSAPIDIDNWQLLDRENSIVIVFGQGDEVDDYFLLRRILSSEDSGNKYSIAGEVVDKTYKGVIQNSNESLRLFDDECRLVDEVVAGSNWSNVGGSASPDYKTAERGGVNSWHTYSGSGSGGVMGTPRAQNSTPQNINNPSSGSSGSSGGGSNASSPTTEVEFNYCSQDDLNSPTGIVLINEVAWAGTASSTFEEWIELQTSIRGGLSLSGWQLLDKNGEVQIVFKDGDRIEDYLLFKRILTTDDASASYQVGSASVDKVYTGVIQNEGETLRLFDASCNLVDEVVDVGSNWANVGGTTSPDYRTAERVDVSTWSTYEGIGEGGIMGTPRAENSVVSEDVPEEDDESTDEDEGGDEGEDGNEEEPMVLPSLQIAEIIYDVEGADDGQERVRLLNNEEEDVLLENYSLQYLKVGGDISEIKKKNFESGMIIVAREGFVVGMSCSSDVPCEGVDMSWSQSLGNDGGTVYLVANQELLVDGSDTNIINSFVYGGVG
ncbi:lamin tail domain-containing protein [Patescibacteria group bacterium]|nr:lamin tail domain-containing protein [Patescibacteria group bacterium]